MVNNLEQIKWLMTSLLQEYFIEPPCEDNSFIRGNTGILLLLLLRDFRLWVSFSFTLKRGCIGFIYQHGYRRCHNWRGWDRFVWITLGTLEALRARRSLNSLRSLTSFSSLGSWRSAWSVFTWRASGTRPASSSPDAFGTLNRAGLATQSESQFFSDEVTVNSSACVWFLVFSFHIAFVTNLQLCNQNTTGTFYCAFYV